MSNQAEVHVSESTTPVVVEVLVPGPQGPAAASYMHLQLSASSTWTLAHNLGFRPSVELFNSANQGVEADIVHLSENVCIATFNLPITGFARLN